MTKAKCLNSTSRWWYLSTH